MVDKSEFRVLTRYMGSGITPAGSGITAIGFGITAAGSGITSHGIRSGSADLNGIRDQNFGQKNLDH